MTTNKNLEYFFNQYKDIIQTGLEYDYSEKEIIDQIYKTEFNNYIRKVIKPRLEELNHVANFVKKFRNKELDYNTKSEVTTCYKWKTEPNACERCKELDRQVFDYELERPHPNCKCEIEEVSGEEAEMIYEEHEEDIKKKDKNINDLKEIVGKESKKQCAHYVGNVVEKSFPEYTKIKKLNAKDNGVPLEKVGFYKVSEGKNYEPRKGDIKIYQPYDAFEKDGKNYSASNPAGHMQIFNGEQWVSDFKQGETPRSINNEDNGLYPNPGYENSNTPSQIYRHAKWQEWK